MTNAISNGLPKLRIEEAATKKQAKIDSGLDQIIGVNSFKNAQESFDFDILEIDNESVKKEQIDRLQEIKSTRNEVDVKKYLLKLETCAKTGDGNLLEIAIKAAKSRATPVSYTHLTLPTSDLV